MDLLIKNADREKEVPVSFTVHPSGHTYIHWDGTVFGETDSVEVPPHGRLIDADKLKAELSKPYVPEERDWYFAEACQFIDEAPTVLEASI